MCIEILHVILGVEASCSALAKKIIFNLILCLSLFLLKWQSTSISTFGIRSNCIYENLKENCSRLWVRRYSRQIMLMYINCQNFIFDRGTHEISVPNSQDQAALRLVSRFLFFFIFNMGS